MLCFLNAFGTLNIFESLLKHTKDDSNAFERFKKKK